MRCWRRRPEVRSFGQRSSCEELPLRSASRLRLGAPSLATRSELVLHATLLYTDDAVSQAEGIARLRLSRCVDWRCAVVLRASARTAASGTHDVVGALARGVLVDQRLGALPRVVKLAQAAGEHGLLLVRVEVGAALTQAVVLVDRALEELRTMSEVSALKTRTEPMPVWFASMRPLTRWDEGT